MKYFIWFIAHTIIWLGSLYLIAGYVDNKLNAMVFFGIIQYLWGMISGDIFWDD